jgi:putative flavoprotein involved in K+ transport
MPERIETVVIGGGQAGLAMSYHLSELGREHIILERGRIAERWRTERWDSLAFQFPNWMLRLPGYAYAGDDPDGFMLRDGVARFMEDYARQIAPPLRCGFRVTALRQVSGTTRLAIDTEHFSLEATNVVVATGPYQEPSIPGCSVALPLATYQLTANRYTNSDQLPPGRVLVVGSGASGYQIADDLLQSGRDVCLSVGRHRRVPRRYRGKDFGWWQDKMGLGERIAESVPGGVLPPLLTGVNGGQDVDLRRLAKDGVLLVGSLRGIDAGRLFFAPDLEANLTKGDEGVLGFKRLVDEFIAKHGLVAPEDPQVGPISMAMPSSTADLDLRAAGITSVIWATGYRYDFSWIKCSVLTEDGKPVHRRGVTSVPGVYFLGLPFLHKIKSSFLWGVGEDAAHIAEHVTAGHQIRDL